MTAISIESLGYTELVSLKNEMVGTTVQEQEETWGVSMKDVEDIIAEKRTNSAIGLTVEDTEQGIQADLGVIQNYEDEYQSLIATQNELEKTCSAYKPSNVMMLANSILTDFEAMRLDVQIAQLEQLIATTQKVIETLEKENEAVTTQIAERQAQSDALSQDMTSIDEQIKQNQEKAQEITDKFVEDNKAKIERAAEEYKAGNYEAKGITIEEFIAERVGTMTIPGEVEDLSSQSQNLYDQLQMKGGQLKLIADMMDKLQKVLEDVNGRLSEQSTKLTTFNKNLASSQQYRMSLTFLSAQYKEQDNRPKKKKWYKRAANCVKDAVGDTFKVVKRGVKNIFGSIGDVAKFAGNKVGHVVDKYLGMDKIGHGIQAMGKFVDGAYKMVGGISTFDKKDIKDSYKYMEDNATQALTTAVILAGGVAGDVGGAVVTYGAAKLGVFSAIGDAVKSVTGEIGRFVDRRLGLDSLGHDIQSIGKVVEGASDVFEGTIANDDAKYDAGRKNINENIKPALRGVAITAVGSAIAPDAVATASAVAAPVIGVAADTAGVIAGTAAITAEPIIETATITGGAALGVAADTAGVVAGTAAITAEPIIETATITGGAALGIAADTAGVIAGTTAITAEPIIETATITGGAALGVAADTAGVIAGTAAITAEPIIETATITGGAALGVAADTAGVVGGTVAITAEPIIETATITGGAALGIAADTAGVVAGTTASTAGAAVGVATDTAGAVFGTAATTAESVVEFASTTAGATAEALTNTVGALTEMATTTVSSSTTGIASQIIDEKLLGLLV